MAPRPKQLKQPPYGKGAPRTKTIKPPLKVRVGKKKTIAHGGLPPSGGSLTG